MGVLSGKTVKAKSCDIEAAAEEGKKIFPSNFYIEDSICTYAGAFPCHFIEEIEPVIFLHEVCPKPEYGQRVNRYDCEKEEYGEVVPGLVELWMVPTKKICDFLLSPKRGKKWEPLLSCSAKDFVSGATMKLWEEAKEEDNSSPCPHCGQS